MVPITEQSTAQKYTAAFREVSVGAKFSTASEQTIKYKEISPAFSAAKQTVVSLENEPILCKMMRAKEARILEAGPAKPA